MPEVSIITVYYNTPEELLKLFDSIEKYLEPSVYEFIVADNNSESNLSAKLSSIKYIRFNENLGFGKACNRAAEQATAPILFFMNPDSELIHNCLPPMLVAMKDFAVAGPQVINSDRSLQLSFGPFLSIAAEAKQRFLTKHERDVWVQRWIAQKTAGPFYPDYVSGCALMIRTSVFQQLHGFDEDFFLYNEDVDLCARAQQAGHKIVYIPSAQLIHHRNRSVQKEPNRVKVEYRRSQILYYRKHLSKLSLLGLRLYLTIKFVLQWSMLRVIWGR
ncbi:MAG: hypothetical protein C5B54_04095 [Acidobacteria bacterium]|nr:MAG: hypothetical protein C5B54_04095 [Acidobacteriota bacterium]